MVQSAPYQVYAIGDQGITLDYGGEMSESVNSKIFQLYKVLKEWQPDAVLDIIPAYHSISLIYDLMKIKKLAGSYTAFQFLEMKLKLMEATIADATGELITRKIDIPVCYDASLGPDLHVVFQGAVRCAEGLRAHRATRSGAAGAGGASFSTGENRQRVDRARAREAGTA